MSSEDPRPEVAQEETSPDVAERYIMMDRLGEGTYGTVYRAETRAAPHQEVAIKRIRVLHEDGVPAVALREIALLKTLNHENVIKLLDVCNSWSSIYLVFECLDMDLRAYLKRFGKLEGQALRKCSWQCFRGIEFCHSNRVLHRDLKPQNVLVKLRWPQAPRLVLADFGLARALNVPLK
ncbi:CDKA-1, partial [Symbiodinium sp. CCMP2592]